jgi:hypothetical protein
LRWRRFRSYSNDCDFETLLAIGHDAMLFARYLPGSTVRLDFWERLIVLGAALACRL